MMYIVKVGTDKDTAQKGYAEMAGVDYFGPMDAATAPVFCNAVSRVFAEAEMAEGGEIFVYGNPVVEVIALRDFEGGVREGARKAAKNWFLTAEQRAQDEQG